MKSYKITFILLIVISIPIFHSCKKSLRKLIDKQHQKIIFTNTKIPISSLNGLYQIYDKKFQDITRFAEKAVIIKNRPPSRSFVFGKGVPSNLGIVPYSNDTTFIICKPLTLINCIFTKEWWTEQKSTIVQRPISFFFCKFIPDRYDHSPKHDRYFISETSFDSIVTFQDTKFDIKITFSEDIFHGPLVFTDHIWPINSPEFASSSFEKGVSFNNYMPSSTNFSNTKNRLMFKDNLEFIRCTIHGLLDISNCHFDSNATLVLKETFLPDTLDLSNTILSKAIDFTESYPNINAHKCEINLMGADISLIRMQYKNFHLYISDSIADDPFSKDIISRTYESLLTNFKNNGFTDSYEQLDKEYKLWQSKYNWSLKLSYIWWQFGYEKWYIMFWTFAFLILFSLFNHNKYLKLQSVYPMQKLEWGQIKYTPSPFIHRLKKYFITLLYTGYIFFRLSIDFKNLNSQPMRYVAIIIIQYSIGLVCTGFLINWILKG